MSNYSNFSQSFVRTVSIQWGSKVNYFQHFHDFNNLPLLAPFNSVCFLIIFEFHLTYLTVRLLHCVENQALMHVLQSNRMSHCMSNISDFL